MEKVCFAYGSNMNWFQMRGRCGDHAKAITRAYLPGWEIEFRGVLTIVQKPKAMCEGGLWAIDSIAEKALDRYEGYPSFYRKETVTAFLEDRTPVDVLVYVMNGGTIAPPPPRYLATCVEGAVDFEIDPETLYVKAGEAKKLAKQQAF